MVVGEHPCPSVSDIVMPDQPAASPRLEATHICCVIGRTRHKMMIVEIQEAFRRGARLIELRLDFLAKAPAEVVEKIRARQKLAAEEVDRITARLASLQ